MRNTTWHVSLLPAIRRNIRQFRAAARQPKAEYFSRSVYLLIGFLLSPLAALIAPFVAKRFEMVEPMMHRFGSLITVPDFNLKRLRAEGSRKRLILLAPIVANSYLLDLWRHHMTVFTNSFVCSILCNCFIYTSPLRRKYRIGRWPDIDRTYYGLTRTYEPLLKGAMGQRDIERGRQMLAELGLPRSAWFVTFHAREPTYLANLSHYSAEFRDVLTSRHAYRDFDITDYIPSMSWVVANGGWAVRLGEVGSKPLPDMPGVIDYANSPLKSAFLDVFVCSQCAFFMGCNSGPVDLATGFGVPAASVNFLPWSGAHRAANMVMISKFVWSKAKQRYLSFPELFAGEKGTYYDTQEYKSAGLEVHNNTPQDLLKVTIETCEMAYGKACYSEEDERLQARFKDIIPSEWPSKEINARLGRDFLRDYIWLLGDDPPPSEPIPGTYVQVK